MTEPVPTGPTFDHASYCAQCDAPADEILCEECCELLALDEEHHQLSHMPGAI